MSTTLFRLGPFAAVAVLLVTSGCFGGGSPAAVTAPDVDPQAAAEKAMASYDADGDGALRGAEIAAVPAIERFLKEYDLDRDNGVSESEIARRLEAVLSSGAMMPFTCTIIYGNQPLGGAEVTFQPEVFLADQLKPARGVTNANGTAPIVVPDDQLPEGNRGLRAMYLGIYKVTVTHPTIKIPAAYQGDDTVLGYEVNGLDNWGDKVTFQLDSRGSKPK